MQATHSICLSGVDVMNWGGEKGGCQMMDGPSREAYGVSNGDSRARRRVRDVVGEPIAWDMRFCRLKGLADEAGRVPYE
jgi:hypothetical protein